VDFPGFGVDVVWAPDGKRLAVTKLSRDQTSESVLLDPETGKTEPFDPPAGVLDWSRDGKRFLVVYLKDKKLRLGLAEKGEKEARELTELKLRFAFSAVGRLSPDGKKVLFTDGDPDQKDAYKWHRSSQPHVLDIATKKRQALADFPDNAQCVGLAWSPDGKRVAYAWTQLHPDVLKKDILSPADTTIPTEGFLIIADADGKNAKTVASDKSNQALNPIFGSIDWR
jgi:Tol biopolymer transport system component